jgi:outer membrane protein TolC
LVVAGLALLGVAARAQAPPAADLGLLEALRLALARAPEIRQVEERLAQRRGAWDEARGRFDPRLGARVTQRGERDPASAPATSRASTRASAELAWLLPSGLELTPSLALARVSGAGGEPASATASVTLALVQPLLAGRGQESSAAGARAAQLELQAGAARLRHARATQALRVLRAYWACRAAHDTVRILAQTEARATQFLDEEQRLVAARERAPGDLFQVRASLDEARANRVEGEQGYERARAELALAMGLDWQAAAVLPPPAQALPAPLAIALPAPDALVHLALARRHDLRANEDELQAARTRARAAQRALAPRLDLAAELGYAGAVRGSGPGLLFRPLVEQAVGPNVQVELRLERPLGNRAARGAALREEALARELGLSAEDDARRVASEAGLARRLLEAALRQLGHAHSAADAYAVAKNNELAKLRSNLSTNFDVLQVDSRLTAAQLALVRAQASVADTLAQLRFATGTLLPERLEDLTVASLTSAPGPE